MLIKFAVAEEIYYVFSEFNEESCVDMLVSNGDKFWKSNDLSSDNIMPPSRRNQSLQNYLEVLQTALQRPDPASRIYEFKVNGPILTFVIKETMIGSTTKTLLFKHEFIETDSERIGLLLLLDKSCRIFLEQRDTISGLKRELTESYANVSSLQDEMIAYNSAKDKSQDDLFKNVCLLLNTKKREIDRLRKELAVYSRNNKDNDDDDSGEEVAVVVPPPKQRGKAAAATKANTAKASKDSGTAAKTATTRKATTRTPSYLQSQSQELNGDNIVDYLSQSASRATAATAASKKRKGASDSENSDSNENSDPKPSAKKLASNKKKPAAKKTTAAATKRKRKEVLSDTLSEEEEEEEELSDGEESSADEANNLSQFLYDGSDDDEEDDGEEDEELGDEDDEDSVALDMKAKMKARKSNKQKYDWRKELQEDTDENEGKDKAEVAARQVNKKAPSSTIESTGSSSSRMNAPSTASAASTATPVTTLEDNLSSLSQQPVSSSVEISQSVPASSALRGRLEKDIRPLSQSQSANNEPVVQTKPPPKRKTALQRMLSDSEGSD